MTKAEASSLLAEFQSSTHVQIQLARWINYFGRLCAANALARGFHDDELGVTGSLTLYWDDTEAPEAAVAELAWLDSAILQAELARQASEIGEAVEAVRKPQADSHCPDFSNFLIEEADVLIRIGDTCLKREMPLGEATVAKLLFNLSREHKHGKGS
jgi:NTP pyrophosphatase (non-canonical NTP hydrolase)